METEEIALTTEACLSIQSSWKRVCLISGVACTKFLEGPNVLTSSEQQYFVWNTSSRSTTTPYARNLGGAIALFTHPGYAYEQTMEDTQAESIIASMLEAATLTSSVASPNIWEEPKKLGRAKMLDLRQGTLLCLKYRLSKHKNLFSKLVGAWPPRPPPLATPMTSTICF